MGGNQLIFLSFTWIFLSFSLSLSSLPPSLSKISKHIFRCEFKKKLRELVFHIKIWQRSSLSLISIASFTMRGDLLQWSRDTFGVECLGLSAAPNTH